MIPQPEAPPPPKTPSRLKKAGNALGTVVGVLVLIAGALFFLYIGYLMSFPPPLECTGNITYPVHDQELAMVNGNIDELYDRIARRKYPELENHLYGDAVEEIKQYNTSRNLGETRTVVLPEECRPTTVK